MRRTALWMLVLTAFGQVVHAGAPSDDSFLPIVARAAGAGGRQYQTKVILTSERPEAARVTLSFFAAGHEVPVARTTSHSVPPHGSVAVDLDRHVMARAEGIGSLRIQSNVPIAAVARVFSRAAGESAASAVGATFEAVPVWSAIGHGEATVLPGVFLDEGAYKVYVAETTHQPLHFDLEVIDPAGRPIVSRRMFLGPNAMKTVDLRAEFPLPATTRGSVRLSVVNGSGRFVAAGELLALVSRDSTPFSMTTPTRPRHTMSRAEMSLYGAATLLIAATALWQRRSRDARR